jgi:hypothetical protein
MITATKAAVAIYTESDEATRAFEAAFHDFVERQRRRGVAVTTARMARLLSALADNPIVENYLRQL